MDNQNPGSFMSPAGGGGSAIQRAMQRRGMGGGNSPLVSQNTTSPSAVPVAQPPQQGGIPTQQLSPQSVPAPQAQPAGLPPESPEAANIINALTTRLKSISKVQEANIPQGGM